MPKVSDAYRSARKHQVLAAAFRCFAAEGFHKTSMDDIMRESGMSSGAIYRYFESKDEIIVAMAELRHAQETALLQDFLAGDDLKKALPALAKAFVLLLNQPEEMLKRKVGIQVWAEALRNQKILRVVERGTEQRRLLADSLKRAQSTGVAKRSFKPDAMARLMLAVLQGFILQQAWDPEVNGESFLKAFDLVCKSIFLEKNRRGLDAQGVN